MEQKNVKIFWKPIDGGELKELECVAESDGFELEPLKEPVDVKYDPTPVTKEWSLSFDMVLGNKQLKKIRKLFYCRIPRKAKKRFKTNMRKHGLDVKRLIFSYKRLNQYCIIVEDNKLGCVYTGICHTPKVEKTAWKSKDKTKTDSVRIK